MKLRNSLLALLFVSVACFGLSACMQDRGSDFSEGNKIAELAAVDCTYHNVAEIYNDGTDVLFGINVGYKKAWYEYDGKLSLGVDASKVKIEGPDNNGVVTVGIPPVKVLGIPDVDQTTMSDVYYDKGLLTKITIEDQAKALEDAQDKMAKTAMSDASLIEQAKTSVRELLSKYVSNVGASVGRDYQVKFVDIEE